MQVNQLFQQVLNVGPSVLAPSETIPLLGPGFAMIIDYCLALCLFPTRTAYEELKVKYGWKDFNELYVKLASKHGDSSRRDLWRQSWNLFVNTASTQKFARKPVFARIGVSGSRKTLKDVEEVAAGGYAQADDSDGEWVSASDVSLPSIFSLIPLWCTYVTLCVSFSVIVTTSRVQAETAAPAPVPLKAVSTSAPVPVQAVQTYPQPRANARISASGYHSRALGPDFRPLRPNMTWKQWLAQQRERREAEQSEHDTEHSDDN